MTLKTVLKAASVSLFIFLTALTASAQTITVKGTVVDAADGSPLMGVAVASSTGGGTITDLDGKSRQPTIMRCMRLTTTRGFTVAETFSTRRSLPKERP